MLSPETIQEIADVCRKYGYDFQIALNTMARDGRPWYVIRDQLN